MPLLRIAIAWVCATALALSQTPTVTKPASPRPVKATKSGSAKLSPGTNAPASPSNATPTASGSSAPAGSNQTPAASAGQAGSATRQRQQKIYDVRYADIAVLAGMLNDLRQGSSPDRVIPEPDLHAIAVESANPAFLQSAEQLIRRYDVPGTGAGANHDFEIVAHILVAGRTPVAGDALPADLESVAKHLKETFGYTDVKLVDSALEHAREGRDAMVKGSVNGLSDGAAPSSYEMSHRLIHYEPGTKKSSITLYGFQFKLKISYWTTGQTFSVAQWQDVAFQTDLNIPDGQSVVVGKSKVGTEEKSLILVVKARLLD